MKNYKKIEKLLSEIDIDVSLKDEDITCFDDLTDYLQDNDYFNVEIIYYSNAMEYLSEHDPSLSDSLTLAHYMGCTLDSLNSETLASLLASENVRELYYDLQSDIDELLE